jgi:hypothetical protein
LSSCFKQNLSVFHRNNVFPEPQWCMRQLSWISINWLVFNANFSSPAKSWCEKLNKDLITYNIWGKYVFCCNIDNSSYNTIFNPFYLLSLSTIFPIVFFGTVPTMSYFCFFIFSIWGNKSVVGDGSVHDTGRPLTIQTIRCSFLEKK